MDNPGGYDAMMKTAKYGVEWQPDDATPTCTCCGREFTLLIRRHHCRLCGLVVCGVCSASREPVPGSSNMKRACDNCVMRRMNEHGQVLTGSYSTHEKYDADGNLVKAVANDITASTGDAQESSSMQRPHRESFNSVMKSEKYGVAWQDDEDVKACWICNTEFSFMNRRHHCRKCGKVVCGSCSQNRVPVEGSYNTKRACQRCFDEFGQGTGSGAGAS